MSTMNTVGRPTAPNAVDHDYRHPTLTGGRGLLQDEHLIFESDGWGKTGVDLPEPKETGSDLGDLVRKDPIGLPGLSEPETMRHYVRLSQKNHAIDLAIYPLGSCTMKHNPRLNEKMARLPGFSERRPCPAARWAARIAIRPHSSPCAPALGDRATAGMPVRVFSQWAS